MNLLFSKRENFVGSKALNLAIKFTSASTKQENTMEIIKPNVENLLQNIIIPIMFVSESDVETFQADPVEYIRSQYDFTDNLF